MSCGPDAARIGAARHEAAIDHDLLPIGQARRTEHEIAGAFDVVAERRAAGVDQRVAVLEELARRKRTRRNSELSGVMPGPFGGGGSATGASLSRRSSVAISASFQALRSSCQVPSPSRTTKRRERAQRPATSMPALAALRGAVTARPAIERGLRRRGGDIAGRSSGPSSGAAAAASSTRISGSHSTACTQSGGSYLNSTISAQPTTMKPAMRMTNTAGPSPASAKA